ncbi:MAG: NAD(P)/FAD-dependent oxidoreductase, partial [Thermodesulfobacteriota bacterium]
MYDLIIIGGGPAAAGASVYAGRSLISTLVLTRDFQGQSTISPDIRNWIGEVSISGMDLSEKLEEHVRNQPGLTVKSDEQVKRIDKTADGYQVQSDNDSYTSRTVIVASGGRRKRLQVPGEEKLEGLGVAYCATCDAPLFEDEDVVVVGAGNSALETVIDLSGYARKIYVLTRGDRLKGDPVNRKKVEDLSDDRLTLITEATVQSIQGQDRVQGLTYYDKKARDEKSLEVSGVFVAIGSVPNSGLVQKLVDKNEGGEIIVDHKTGLTSDPNIGAAGDVTDDPFKQNNIAVAGGVRAALSLYSRLLQMKKYSPCSEPE